MTSHVLVLHSSDEAYGSDRICVEIVRNLVDRGCRVTLALPDDSPPGWLSEQVGKTYPSVTVIRVALAVARRQALSPRGLLRWGANAVQAQRHLRQFVKRADVDVVYLNSLALLPQVLDVRLGALRILHCHEIATMLPLRIVQRLSVRLVDHVICVSQAVANAFPSNEVHICRNGIADVGEQPQGMVGEGPLRVGFVGRLSQFKGIEKFLELASIIDRDDVQFEVTGGPIPGQRHFLDIVEEASNGRLVYRGEIDDTSTVFGELDVLVVPSATPDPYPTVVLEGLRGGCVIIATALGGASEAFESDCGFTVDPADVEGMARLIEDLAADRGRVARMQNAARETYDSQHRLEAFDARFRSTLDVCGVGHSPTG